MSNITSSIKKEKQKMELYYLLQEVERRKRERKIEQFFPDTGPLRRELYKKHLEFYRKGKSHKVRLFMAGNRVGKTDCGLIEVVYHATGRYPSWWEGKRFDKPILIWCAGDTSKTIKDILVRKLLGAIGELGTGHIPKECIVRVTAPNNVRDSAETILIKHISGGVSQISLKSYEQQRESFQGSAVDLILLDEEPPKDIYTECFIRTMTTGGIVMLTFTPLNGMSDVVTSFLNDGDINNPIDDDYKCVVMAGWDDVPHLSDEDKKIFLAELPEFQRESRSKGIPQMGLGAIYRIPLEKIQVDPFEIPRDWKFVYGLDVGFRRTACIWGALDPSTDILYLYDEYYEAEKTLFEHAKNIKARGAKIPGVIDPASEQRSQIDGVKMIDLYRKEGLVLTPARNYVEAGIADCWNRMSKGKLKVFSTLENFGREYRLYRKEEVGKNNDVKVVKKDDHLMDAMRYLVVSGVRNAKSQIEIDKEEDRTYNNNRANPMAWASV